MTLKSLFFYFSRDSRIARLHVKYDRLKHKAAKIQQILERAHKPESVDEWPAYMVFVEHDEPRLRAKLKCIVAKGDKCRHAFLFLEWGRDHEVLHA